MKKIILFCTLFISALGAFAQDTPPYTITEQNMQEILADLFASPRAATPHTRATQKKWQAAFFLTSNNITWDQINDLTHKLISEYQNGNLQYAIVLYDRIATEEPYMRQHENGIYLYAIGDFSPTKYKTKNIYTEAAPAYTYFFRPDLSQHSSSVADLLDQLLSRLNKRANTYNYFKIHAHGSGTWMTHYAQDKLNFTFKTIHDAIKKRNIHIDVLDVHSCMMGRVDNAKAVLASGNVDYVIFSSNVTLTKFTQHNTPFLNYLHEKPGQAARDAVNAQFLQTYISKNTTNNLMLVSRQAKNTLQELAAWLKTDYPKHTIKRSQLPAINDKANRNWNNYSLNRLLRTWQDLVSVTIQDNKNVKLKFKAKQLRSALQKSILSYRCWDASQNILYTDVTQVPADSECMDGMTIHIVTK